MRTSTSKGNKFGTFSGVFTPSILTIFGVIMFMRTNFVVGEVGVYFAIAILIIAQGITFFTSLSVCAISTNMKIEGGGAYYMISRVLGAEFGGAIGVALFLASALSVPFYIIGFTEAVTATFPALIPHSLAIMLITLTALFIITLVGADLAIRAQYIIMIILISAIIAFLGGAIQHFNSDTFEKNLRPPAVYTVVGDKHEAQNITKLKEKYLYEIDHTVKSHIKAKELEPTIFESTDFFRWISNLKRYSFWLVFAIFFPAVTGILAGINMSGDLKDPMKSIPRGTMLAVGTGFIVYLGQIIIFGGAFDRVALIDTPYQILKDTALFSDVNIIDNLGGATELSLGAILVSSGVMVATLSSALGSFLGAPRILQALANDKSLSGITYFSKGSGSKNEPRRGTALTFIGSLCILLWAALSSSDSALNIVAKIVTMFFMLTYGTINVAAFLEAYSANPSFRPRFRFFNYYTALLGAVGSIVVAVLIDAEMTLVSVSILALLFYHIKRRKPDTNFHDARQGFLFDVTRSNLLKLSQNRYDTKNWRPIILTFTTSTTHSAELIRYSSWIESGKGLLYIAKIVNTEKVTNYLMTREATTKDIANFCKKEQIKAFPIVTLASNFKDSYGVMLQSVSLGTVKPNIIINPWDESILTYEDRCKEAESLHYSLVLLKEGRAINSEKRKQIDIWWRGRKNGNLMVIISHLISQNKDWSNTEIRLIRIVKKEAGVEPALEALDELIHQTRMKITPKVLVSEATFNDVFKANSTATDCAVIGLELPKTTRLNSWYTGTDKLLSSVDCTVLLVDATGDEDVTA